MINGVQSQFLCMLGELEQTLEISNTSNLNVNAIWTLLHQNFSKCMQNNIILRRITRSCEIPFLCITSSKAQSSWRLTAPLLGDHINHPRIPENLFVFSPKTANSLQPLCPLIISSILPQQEGTYKK